MTSSEFPEDMFPELGEHSPKRFHSRPPEEQDELEDDHGAPIEEVYVPELGPPIFDPCDYKSRVYVAVTEQLYLTQVVLLEQDGSVASKKSYAAGEARKVAKQMRENNSPALESMLGEENVQILADFIVSTANMCSTLSIGEHAGMDTLHAFQDNKITAEEFMHETMREMDKMF